MRNRFLPGSAFGRVPVAPGLYPPNRPSRNTYQHPCSHGRSDGGFQYIYVRPEWTRRIFGLLTEKITGGKACPCGRSLYWDRLNTSWDELHCRANDDTLLRGILGVLPTDYSAGTRYEYQNIYDNVRLLDEEVLHQINDVIVQVGHQVVEKKR